MDQSSCAPAALGTSPLTTSIVLLTNEHASSETRTRATAQLTARRRQA